MTGKLSKNDADRVAAASDIVALSDFLVNYPDKTQLTEWYKNDGYQLVNSPEENARQIIRSTQYFDSWDEFEQFREAIQNEDSEVWQFEQAGDAIAIG